MLQLIGGLAILLAGWSNANDNKFEKKGSKIDWTMLTTSAQSFNSLSSQVGANSMDTLVICKYCPLLQTT